MALTTREQDFSEWYNELVEQAGLAETSDVRGCMVIKPYGYAIRERMKDILDAMFKATGHVNAYFPLFIPKSYLAKEANHVEGFAKECAVVTHYRLKADPEQGVIVDPDAKLEEELIVRPTSETIIRNTYKKRIHSYRDLPLLINQRANVVRWEMRTRIFLRTSEFLWQEGHTAHATDEEAEAETRRMLEVYLDFFRNVLAIDPVPGKKSESEKFAGAQHTYTLEAFMQDGKALQSCTSHHLGQNFAKAFDVKFTNKNNEDEYVWATSWGASTRMMGGLILSHSDDKGLVLPPLLAPIHVAVVPVFKNTNELRLVQEYISPVLAELREREIVSHSSFGGISSKSTFYHEISDADFGIDATGIEVTKQREAVRALLLDDEGNVGVCYVKSGNYYKLPGGGVEEGEDLAQALAREIEEEAGVKAVVLRRLGTTVEKRIAQAQQIQTSHIYLAKVVGPKGNANYTQKEQDDGFEIQWMPLDDLLKILATNTHDNDYIINFMAKRDSFVFDRYKRESTHAYSIPVVTEVDTDDQNSPGRKYAEYELKGVPVRIAVGPRDMQNGTVELYRRDTGEKQTIKREDVVDVTMHILHDMQKTLRTKNKLLREANTVSVTTYEEFKKALDDGKFVMAHRDGTAETEEKIKEECKCVTRCIPFNAEEEQGICVYTGKPSTKRVLFARAY